MRHRIEVVATNGLSGVVIGLVLWVVAGAAVARLWATVGPAVIVALWKTN